MENEHKIKIQCKKCGAQLDVDANLTKVFCQYCGTQNDIEVDSQTKIKDNHSEKSKNTKYSDVKAKDVKSVLLKNLHIILGVLLGIITSLKIYSILKIENIIALLIIFVITCTLYLAVFILGKRKIKKYISSDNKLDEMKKDLLFIKKYWKIIFPVVGIVCIAIIFLVYKDYENGLIKDIEIPKSSSECVNDSYNNIYDVFHNAGFINIEYEPAHDLLYSDINKENKVISVSIDGNDDFQKGDVISSDKVVSIKYHSANMIKPPVSSDSLSGMNYEEVKQQFIDAGFTNVEEQSVEDLITGWIIEDGEIDEIVIDDKTSFSKSDSFYADSSIIIKYHTFPSSASINEDSQETNTELGEEIEDGAESETQETVKERTQKKEFNEKTNNIITFLNYDFSVPTYWETDDLSEGHYRAYAETGGKVAMLEIWANQDIEPVSFDVLNNETEKQAVINNFMEGMEFENSDISSIEVFDNNVIKGILYKFSGETNGIKLQVQLLCFGSESDNRWFYCLMGYNDGTDYLYDNDFEKIIKSINYSTIPLQSEIPREYKFFELASRAAIVAITNGYADDVFKSDGFTYDVSKLHSYSDLSGFYMTVEDIGEWTKKEENKWHVEHLKLQAHGYSIVTDAKLDVEYNGDNYIISNVTGTYGNNDLSELCIGESCSAYLVVPLNLVEEDRESNSSSENKISSSLNESNEDSEKSDYLEELEVRRLIEKYGKNKYGSFECHWFTNYINAEQNSDGDWFIKVGVTVKNAYGKKVDGILEAIVGGTKSNPVLKSFSIY